MFNYFLINKLFMPSQSGFLPGDSSIAHLLSIIYDIQTAVNSNSIVDVRCVFLDISKAFDKVWLNGLIFKIQCWGWITFATQKPSPKSWTKSCLKWSNIWMEKNSFGHSTRICSRTSFISDLYKWFAWRNNINLWNFCWWYISFFKSLRHK